MSKSVPSAHLKFERTDPATNVTWSYDSGTGKWSVATEEFRQSSAKLETLKEALSKRERVKPKPTPAATPQQEDVEVGLVRVHLTTREWLGYQGSTLLSVKPVQARLNWDGKEQGPTVVKHKEVGEAWKSRSAGGTLIHARLLTPADIQMLADALVAARLVARVKGFEQQLRERWFAQQPFSAEAVVGWSVKGRPLELISEDEVRRRPSAHFYGSSSDPNAGSRQFTLSVPTTIPLLVVDASQPPEGWVETNGHTWRKQDVSLALKMTTYGPKFEVMWHRESGDIPVFSGAFAEAWALAEATVQASARQLPVIEHWAAQKTSYRSTYGAWPDRREDVAALIVLNAPGIADIHLLGRKISAELEYDLERWSGSKAHREEDAWGWHQPHRLTDCVFRAAGPLDNALGVLRQMQTELRQALGALPAAEHVHDRLQALSVQTIEDAYGAAGDGDPWDTDPEAAQADWDRKWKQVEAIAARSTLLEEWGAKVETAGREAQQQLVAPETAPKGPKRPSAR